jgi:hypothetical protein
MISPKGNSPNPVHLLYLREEELTYELERIEDTIEKLKTEIENEEKQIFLAQELVISRENEMEIMRANAKDVYNMSMNTLKKLIDNRIEHDHEMNNKLLLPEVESISKTGLYDSKSYNDMLDRAESAVIKHERHEEIRTKIQNSLKKLGQIYLQELKK